MEGVGSPRGPEGGLDPRTAAPAEGRPLGLAPDEGKLYAQGAEALERAGHVRGIWKVDNAF